MRTLTLPIDERLAGRTVKSLLAQELRMSESLIRRVKLRETGILLNGVRAFTTASVQAGPSRQPVGPGHDGDHHLCKKRLYA